MSKWKRANRVYIDDSENQHLISLSVVFNRVCVYSDIITECDALPHVLPV